MKKLTILLLVFAFVTLAAFTTRSRWSVEQPEPSPLIDSVKVFDIKGIKKMHPTTAALIQAARYYQAAMDSMDIGSDAVSGTMLMALRSYPVPSLYNAYESYSNREDNTASPGDLADSLRGSISATQYMDAAKYALSRRDTASMIHILEWYMNDNPKGYQRVDKEAFLRPLENYPAYYYMMDEYVQNDSAVGYQGTFRTLRHTTATALPLSVSLDVIDKHYETRFDSATSAYVSYEFELRDDAMRDLVRGNRFGRFGRETDHSVQHVATLHLSDKFYTYVYSQQNWYNKMMEEEVVELTETDSVSTETAEMPVHAKPDLTKASPEVYNGANRIFIVNIDKYGKKISEQQIACKCSPMHVSTAVIDKNGQIEVKDQEQKWKNDPLTAGYEKNEVVRGDVTAITHYKVKTNGEIVQIADATTERAQK